MPPFSQQPGGHDQHAEANIHPVRNQRPDVSGHLLLHIWFSVNLPDRGQGNARPPQDQLLALRLPQMDQIRANADRYHVYEPVVATDGLRAALPRQLYPFHDWSML